MTEFINDEKTVHHGGNYFHGYLQDGIVYSSNGAVMSLPTGVEYNPAPDGSSRLIDIGADAIETGEADQYLGGGWWNKALLSGSGFGSGIKVYNDVRGADGGAIQFRRSAWVYKCPDGTVYTIWLSSEKKIRVEKWASPSSTVPSNDTGGTIVLDISSQVLTERWVGGVSHPLYSWLNFAPDGTKAALHFGYRHATSAPTQYTYQIFEFDVSGGGDVAVPSVTLTRYRSLEPGEGLFIEFSQAAVPGWYQGPNDANPVLRDSGTAIERDTTVLFVDYSEGGLSKEVSVQSEQSTASTPFIDAGGHSDVAVVVNNSLRVMVNGASVMALTHYYATDPSVNSGVFDTVVIINITSPADHDVKLLYGNIAFVGTAGITYSTTGAASGTTIPYGIVGANAVIGDAQSALGPSVNATDIAVDPITGSFMPGRTRYF